MNHPGGIFDPALPERASASVEVGVRSVIARVASGETFELPFAGLRLEFGGASGRMLFLRGAAEGRVIFSESPQLLSDLRARGDAAIRAACDGADAGLARGRQLAVAGWAAFLGAVALVVWIMPAAFRGAVEQAVAQVPLSVDRQLGDLVAGEVAKAGPPVTAPEVTAFARELTDRLDAAMEDAIELRVTVVDNPDLNAFALPGGRIALFSGVLKAATSVDVIAGVLAHEAAHVALRHGVGHMAHSLGMVASINLFFGDVSAVGTLLTESATLAAVTDYSRDQEAAADAEGARLLQRAGFDPHGLVRFLQHVHEARPDDPLAAWVGTHPPDAARIAALEALIPTLPPGESIPLAHDLAAAQAALP